MNIQTRSEVAAVPASIPAQAARVHRFGPPDVITLDDVGTPEPDAGEVLVRVKAAGVGPWDAQVRAGKTSLPRTLPLTLGSELSGVIAALGAGVTDFRVGDAVFGVTNPCFTGACADYAVASAGMIARKPDRLDHIDAASVPMAAAAAWQALFKQAALVRGRAVLIHGAAGNVGAYAVQLARWAGLRIVATAGARDLAFVRGVGAEPAGRRCRHRPGRRRGPGALLRRAEARRHPRLGRLAARSGTGRQPWRPCRVLPGGCHDPAPGGHRAPLRPGAARNPCGRGDAAGRCPHGP